MAETQNRYLRTSHNLLGSSQLGHISTIGKNLLNSNISPTSRYNTVNFGLLTAETCWRVWGTPANFNGFRILAALRSFGVRGCQLSATGPFQSLQPVSGTVCRSTSRLHRLFPPPEAV